MRRIKVGSCFAEFISMMKMTGDQAKLNLEERPPFSGRLTACSADRKSEPEKARISHPRWLRRCWNICHSLAKHVGATVATTTSAAISIW